MRTPASCPEIDSVTYIDNKPNADRTPAPDDQVAAFLSARTFFCEGYEARITPEQCATNKEASRGNDYGKFFACRSCPGQAGSSKPKSLSRAGRPPKADASARPKAPDTPWRQNPGFVPNHYRQTGNATIDPEVPHADPAVVDEPAMPKVMSIMPNIMPATPPENIKEKETVMSSNKGDCPLCGRKDVHLPSPNKCSRCYSRIAAGKDPVTGEAKVITSDNSPTVKPTVKSQPKLMEVNQDEAKPSLVLEDVQWGLIKLGYKAHDIKRALGKAAFAADVTAEEAIKVIINQLSGKGPGKETANEAKPVPAPPTQKAEVKPQPQAEPEPTFIYQNDPIVRFKGSKDKEMLKWLYEQAEFNRRTLEQEILFRLDRTFDARRVIAAYRAAQNEAAA